MCTLGNYHYAVYLQRSSVCIYVISVYYALCKILSLQKLHRPQELMTSEWQTVLVKISITCDHEIRLVICLM